MRFSFRPRRKIKYSRAFRAVRRFVSHARRRIPFLLFFFPYRFISQRPARSHDDHHQVYRIRSGRGTVRDRGRRLAGHPETGWRRRREPSAVRGRPRRGARAEAERQVRGPGRVQLRHAQAGHVHEQVDEEEHAGVRRNDGDR